MLLHGGSDVGRIIAVSPAALLEAAHDLTMLIAPAQDQVCALLDITFSAAASFLNYLLLNQYNELGPWPRYFTNTVSHLMPAFSHYTNEALKDQRN